MSSTEPDRLLLFDIDGTLVDTEGAGLDALKEGFFSAFPEVSHRDFPELDLAGATDGSVANFLFKHFELPNEAERVQRFFRCYTDSLKKSLVAFSEKGRGRLLGGVKQLLGRLSTQSRYGLGLLTGNLEDGAYLKLEHFGIDHYFSFGAFGDDHPDRNALGPIALRRAAKAKDGRFAGADTLIIGDTPKDIACARAFGAKVIAVATGSVDRETLAAANPDGVLDDFSDIDQVTGLIDAVLSEQACHP